MSKRQRKAHVKGVNVQTLRKMCCGKSASDPHEEVIYGVTFKVWLEDERVICMSSHPLKSGGYSKAVSLEEFNQHTRLAFVVDNHEALYACLVCSAAELGQLQRACAIKNGVENPPAAS